MRIDFQGGFGGAGIALGAFVAQDQGCDVVRSG